MRAKLVNEAIKHLQPREFSPEDNLERALDALDNAERQYSDEDRENVIKIIKTLTELDFITLFSYSWIFSAYKIQLIDYNNKYAEQFICYYIPSNYNPGPGLEITEKSEQRLYANAHYLRPTMDMNKVKEFFEQFRK